MFGSIATLFLGAYTLVKGFDNKIHDEKSKSEAIKNGELSYYDSKFKQRHVKTNEIVISNFTDTQHNGHDTLVGVKTNKLYMDYTQEGVDAANSVVRNKGKKYIWKEYEQLSKWYPFDVEKKMPYRLTTIPYRHYELQKGNKKGYQLQYLEITKHSAWPDRSIPTIYLTEEEAEPYNYGFLHTRSSRNFATSYRTNHYDYY